MKLLLDTHLLLWAAGSPGQLSVDARHLLEDRDNELFFSVVSLWEVVIKQGLGRIDFQVDAHLLRRALLDHDYQELAIRSEHVMSIASLPLIHKDPFDRLLVAQATSEGILLLTSDALVAQYPGPLQYV